MCYLHIVLLFVVMWSRLAVMVCISTVYACCRRSAAGLVTAVEDPIGLLLESRGRCVFSMRLREGAS